MKISPQGISKFPGGTPHLVAYLCIAALIFGLLVTNYISQQSLQRVNLQRFQHGFEERALSINYFFSEREGDLLDLAATKPVTGFFANRALGMTMAYGLKASLNSVTRLFNRKVRENGMGDAPIYSYLFLLDKDGRVLTRWPYVEMAEYQPVPLAEEVGDSRVIVQSHSGGYISFTAPVYHHDSLQGFIRGWVDYDLLINYLFGEISGLLLVTSQNSLAYQSRTGPEVILQKLRAIQQKSGFEALQIRRNDLLRSSGQKAENDKLILFSAAVPDYDIQLFLIEKSSAVIHQQGLFIFMGVLVGLSVSIFLVAAGILRANTKNMLLENSLAETRKSQRILREQKERLELVIEGARLGSWDWNILDDSVVFSERWASMLGYTLDELSPNITTWKKLIHPDDRDMVIAGLQAHLEGRSPVYRVEHRLRHKSGKWIWILDSGKVLRRDEQGEPLQASGIHLDITEQKEAQTLINKAKEESDEIIRTFLDSLIVVNKELRITRVNQATCDLLNYQEEDLLGRPISELFHDPPVHVECVFSFYGKEAKHKEFHGREELRNIELSYKTNDGVSRPMSFNISPVKDEQGEITGVVAGAKDISELKTTMNKVASQKAYIERIFDVVPEGLLTLSSSFHIMKKNHFFINIISSWANRFSLHEEELTKKLLLELHHSFFVTKQYDFTLTHNEQTAYFVFNAVAIPSKDGFEHVVSLRDITAERKAEAARLLLSTVIDQTADSVIVTNIDGNILYVNPATLKNSGYERRELAGKPLDFFHRGLISTDQHEELWQAVTNGNVWHGRLSSRNKNGEIIEEDTIISPVRCEDDSITNFVSIKRDVTVMDLLQRRLLQAQKLESIGVLAAGIAHEINTPIQYVQNNITFLRQAIEDLSPLINDYLKLQTIPGVPLDNKAVEHLQTIDVEFCMEEIPCSFEEAMDGIGRVVKIISAMKEFSHPGSEEKTACDLNRAIENTVVVCRNEWKYVTELETDLDPDLPMVTCSCNQFNQAILNLILNAVHAIEDTEASGHNPRRINITTRHEAGMVETRISDTGCGIPDDIRDNIFDPFFTTKEVGRGSGQGLAIVYDIIVRKHGGHIAFESTKGKGTTFIIRLPITGNDCE